MTHQKSKIWATMTTPIINIIHISFGQHETR